MTWKLVVKNTSYSIHPGLGHNNGVSNPIFNNERQCPLLQPNKEEPDTTSIRLKFPYVDSVVHTGDSLSPRGELREFPQLTTVGAFTVNTQTPYRSSSPSSPSKPN